MRAALALADLPDASPVDIERLRALRARFEQGFVTADLREAARRLAR